MCPADASADPDDLNRNPTPNWRRRTGTRTEELTVGYPPFDEQFEIHATDPGLARRLIGRRLVNEHVAGRAPTWTVQGQDLYTLQGSSPDRPRGDHRPTRFVAAGDGPAGPLTHGLRYWIRWCSVARAGIEPATFRFSGGRSCQLSYLARRHRCASPPLATLTGLEPATSAVTGRRANQLRHRALLLHLPSRAREAGTPYGIRTRATALKGRRPRPLDEGGLPNLSGVLATQITLGASIA